MSKLRGRYELKEAARIGLSREDDKEGRVLTRIIMWNSQGVEYEADPRQAEKLIEELGLEGASTAASLSWVRGMLLKTFKNP